MDVWLLKNRYKTELLIELHNTLRHYSAHKICQKKVYEKKKQTSK